MTLGGAAAACWSPLLAAPAPAPAPALPRRPPASGRRVLLLLAGGSVSLVAGALSLAWPPLSALLQEKMRMRPGLPPFEWWLQPPDILLRVYPFNVTNGERFLAGAEPRLRLQQVGPIVFRERLRHDGIAFNANGTLTYTAHRSVHPAPELSALRPEDPLLVPNLAVLSLASHLHDSSVLTKYGASLLVRGLRSQPLVRMTVDHFLRNNTDPLLGVLGTLLPSFVPFDNMGILQWVYGSYSDQATVYVGPDNAERFFTMSRYRGSPRFGNWPQERCDSVDGVTEGLFYRQRLTRNDTLRMFRKTSCRPSLLQYAGDAVKDGMGVFRYELPDGFYNRSADPEGDCFAGPPSAPLLPGLSDISPCYYGFPLAGSNPHFLDGHRSLLEGVDGLAPDREQHLSHVLVEPLSGIPVEGVGRGQVNLVVRPVSGFPAAIQRFSNITIPVVWVEYNYEGLPKGLALLLYLAVAVLARAQVWLGGLLLAGGALAAAAALALALRRRPCASLRLSPSALRLAAAEGLLSRFW